MKQQKAQNTPKTRAEDFPHRMTFQLTEEDYQEYSMLHAAPQWEKNKKKANLYAFVFTVLGGIALVRGFLSQDRMREILLVVGVVLIAYQVFNLIYTYKVFPAALRRSVRREIAKDARMVRPTTLCFDEDKIVSFSGGAHQSSYFLEEVLGRSQTRSAWILAMKNGKNLVIPKRELERADQEIRRMVEEVRETD